MDVYATDYRHLDDHTVAIEVQSAEGDLYQVVAHRGPAAYLLDRIDAGDPAGPLDIEEWLLHPWRIA